MKTNVFIIIRKSLDTRSRLVGCCKHLTMLESIASKIIQLIEIHYNAAEGITRYRVENGVEYDGVLRFLFLVNAR